MKKLAIVALALVLAMTFVGCGANDLRFIGEWDYIYSSATVGDTTTAAATRFTFKDDGTFTSADISLVNGEVKTLVNTKEGKWSTENDLLTIEEHSSSYNGIWKFSFDKEGMKWERDNRDPVTLVKVKK
ncbi:MAG: glycoside hydrolase family 43 C-terminal domain-containing protein [Treponemataceae bacterium]|nr:glycoside hydrolase family 43 C-terminal domain-containing protein [Treponemataceae bacterium]